MINPKDSYVAKVVEQLEKEKLFSSEELSLIEDYLCGDAGEEVLAKIGYHDLSNVAEPQSINNLYAYLLEKGRNDEAKRLEELLFGIGEASCYKMLSLLAFNPQRPQDKRFSLEPAKMVAIHASLLGGNQYRLKKQEFENLIANAENQPECLKKAMEYRTGTSPNGILVLMTTYFYTKYPTVKEGMKLEGEDAALMKRYENLVVESIPQIYAGKLSAQDAKEIMAAVTEDRVDEHILSLADGHGNISNLMLVILGGTAFVNHGLSSILRNVVAVCLAANVGTTLCDIEAMDLRRDLMGDVGGSFDQVFHMCSKDYIQWAARNRKMKILEKQFVRNQDVFLEYMDAADYSTYNMMAPIVKKAAPELFKKRMSGEGAKQQSKLIDAFVRSASAQLKPAADDIRKYLSEGGIEHVYACKDILKNCYYWASNANGLLKTYQMNYGYDALSDRCDTLMLASNGYSLYRDFIDKDSKVDKAQVKRVFAAADAEGLNLVTQLEGCVYILDSGYNETWTKAFKNAAMEVFRNYLAKKREETLSAFKEAGSVGRSFGLSIMAEHAEENKETILSFTQDSAKSVKETLLGILYEQKDWEEDIVALLSSKKAGERDTAIRVLAKWRDEAQAEAAKGKAASNQSGTVSDQGGAVSDKGKAVLAEKYTQILSKALEAEKNAKVRAVLEGVLHMSVEATEGGKVVTLDEMVKELHKGNKKRSLAWAYETPFSKVHKKDGTEADEAYLQAIFLCYCAMSPCGVNQSAAALAKELDEREFAVYVNELFDKWMEAGAESKKRWVLYASAIHGGDDIVKKLHHQIQEWPQEARGAIASEAVQALALSPKPQGLLIVDGISRKFKFKQVKAGAVKALEFAASQLGITTEELADRIVPNLGFDENMQRIFDYGERKFTVTITPALEIEVFDASGKKLKNLPAPGKKDDEVKAAAAYEEFKQMKKQMKTTISSQKMRLEMALSTERQWSVQSWKDLFVKNPIMHQFAIGLIWGVYEDRKLVSSFRYMEDGSFNTEDEEEFILPEDGQDAQSAGQGQSIGRGQSIGLVHPIELSKESLQTWKEQLEDYEIVQSIEQLDRQIYYRTEEEGNQKELERFGGVIVNDLSLSGKLMTQGWYRGDVEDGGCVHTYFREDKELDLGAVLYFSGTYVGGMNEDVTVYEIRFFKSGNLSTWSYDREVEAKSCLLSEVPERYFSEIVLQVTKATAASREKDANWKKGR